MDLEPIVHYLHIVSALAFFVAFGLEWASLVYMRRAATADQALQWISLRNWVQRLGPISLVLLILTGFYMAAIEGGGVWIIVTLAAIVLIAALGATLTGRRLGAIEKAAAEARGAVSPELRQRFLDPLLWVSLRVRLAIALGIVFLMVVKPELLGSLATIVIAIVLGLLSAWPAWRGQTRGTTEATRS